MSIFISTRQELSLTSLPQLDVGSGGGANDPIWHYHSNYDTYHWMATFGDPGFHLHSAMGQYLSLLAFHLLDDEIIPFNVADYAVELRAYLKDVAETIKSADADVDLTELESAIGVFEKEAKKLEDLKNSATELGQHRQSTLVKGLNEVYRDFQRGFVSQGGLPNREFYKHVVAAPGLDTGESPSPCEPQSAETSRSRIRGCYLSGYH